MKSQPLLDEITHSGEADFIASPIRNQCLSEDSAFNCDIIYQKHRSSHSLPILKNIQLLFLLFIITIHHGASSSHLPCSCTPLIYRWRLDLKRTISNSESRSFPGVNISSWEIRNSFADQPLQSVISYKILEFGQKFDDIVKFDIQRNLSLVNGEYIEYTSITKSEPKTFTSGLIIQLSGISSDGENVSFDWIVDYTNTCSVEPYQNGGKFGWLIFDGSRSAKRKSCKTLKSKKLSKKDEKGVKNAKKGSKKLKKSGKKKKIKKYKDL